MTSTTTDRRFGVNSGMAAKVPCRAATTGNITLSGEQTIDGVAIVTGNRVLVRSQTTGANNGIYIADTGTWTRAPDFNGSFDIVKGTFVHITDGTTYARVWFEVTNDSPVIGTTSLTFLLTALGDATAVSFTPAGSGATATTVSAVLRRIVYLHYFGAVGDGATDDSVAWAAFIVYLNTQASAALTSGFPITTAKGRIAAGDYKIDTGATVTNLNVCIEGDGKENTRIRIGAGQYLLTASATIYQLDLRGVATSGGKGVLKHTLTGNNVQGILTIEDNNFHDYTECAIGSLSADIPYVKIRKNLFYGVSTLTSKGVALGGLNDNSDISSNVFLRNKYHLKIAKGGNNAKINDNDFIRFTNGAGAPALTDIWIVPQSVSSTNSGNGLVVGGNKFGNENLNAADYRVLIADEAAGTDFVTKDHATTLSAGFFQGARFVDNAVVGTTSMTAGFVYSYTENFGHCLINNEYHGTQPTNIITYDALVVFSDSRLTKTNEIILRQVFEQTETVMNDALSAGAALVDDPHGFQQGRLGAIDYYPAGHDVGYVDILPTKDITNAGLVGGASKANITDAVGAGNAVTGTYTALTDQLFLTMTMGNITARRTAWVEFDMKQSTLLPLTQVSVEIRSDAAVRYWRGVFNVPTYWKTFRIPAHFLQTATTARLRWFAVDYSAGVKTNVDIGRPRIYHAQEPLHPGYFLQGNTTTQLPAVLKANVNTTAVGNVGGGTDDLMTYSLPANALYENAKGVRITAWGTGANNANGKTVVLAFGSQTLSSQALTANQVDTWEFEALVFRTGASTQDWKASFFQEGVVEIQDVDVGTATQTDTAAITIKCTGAATTDNDIVQEGMLVEFLN